MDNYDVMLVVVVAVVVEVVITLFPSALAISNLFVVITFNSSAICPTDLSSV